VSRTVRRAPHRNYDLLIRRTQHRGETASGLASASQQTTDSPSFCGASNSSAGYIFETAGASTTTKFTEQGSIGQSATSSTYSGTFLLTTTANAGVSVTGTGELTGGGVSGTYVLEATATRY
jgi:hypothetical protein